MMTTNSKMFDNTELDYLNQVLEMSKFYETFAPRVANQLFPEMRAHKKRNIGDYFESSHRSNILKKKTPPRPVKKQLSEDIEEHEVEVDDDIDDGEFDQDFEDFGEHKDGGGAMAWSAAKKISPKKSPKQKKERSHKEVEQLDYSADANEIVGDISEDQENSADNAIRKKGGRKQQARRSKSKQINTRESSSHSRKFEAARNNSKNRKLSKRSKQTESNFSKDPDVKPLKETLEGFDFSKDELVDGADEYPRKMSYNKQKQNKNIASRSS